MATRLVSHDVGASPETSFVIAGAERSYKQQYANLYWLRLAALRARVLAEAKRRWSTLGEERPEAVGRVLDVQTRQLCYIVGTVYVDMALKPNVLADLAREHWLAPLPPRAKFCADNDEVMLEDESGRVRLIGEVIQRGAGTYVTGTIMAVMGAENDDGDFQVVDICYAGLPPQPKLPPPAPAPIASSSHQDDVEMKASVAAKDEGEWIALVSGLEMGGSSDAADLRVQLFAEWLIGELGDDEDQQEAVKVTRLILAGNSLLRPELSVDDAKKPKRYGYDSATYSARPTTELDRFLCKVLPTIAVDLMPGESDPTGPTMPQQALHVALLPEAEAAWGGSGGWQRKTNPFWSRVGDASIFGTSGQTLDDIFKYLAKEDRLEMAEQTLQWSHVAPTCPDTLWCYPFSDRDPFILDRLPHLYFIGNQPTFATKLLEEISAAEGLKRCRIVLLPKFSQSGQVILVNSKTLAIKVIEFGI